MNDRQAPDQQRSARILVLDIETSGEDAAKCGILDIGAVWLLDSFNKPAFNMRCRLWSGALWQAEAEKVHGITYEEATDPSLPTEAEALICFLDWLPQDGSIVIAGLTPSFDRSFVREGMRRGHITGFGEKFPHRIIDLHSLVCGHAIKQGIPIPERGFYTNKIYDVLDLPPEPYPHKAITGAIKEAEALRKLLCLNVLCHD